VGEDEAQLLLAQGPEVVAEADPGTELGVAGQPLLDPRQPDQDDAHPVREVGPAAEADVRQRLLEGDASTSDPPAVSVKVFVHSTLIRASSCRSRICSPVETGALPTFMSPSSQNLDGNASSKMLIPRRVSRRWPLRKPDQPATTWRVSQKGSFVRLLDSLRLFDVVPPQP